MKRSLWTLTLITLFVLTTNFKVKAEVKLPAIFGDHMVLQQKTNAAIWGTATANKTVEVTTSWNNKSFSANVDSEGNWKLKVETPSAGGPYSITISDGKILELKNVLIGEVWVCSGQSNMQMPMNGYNNEPILGSNEAIAKSTNNSIRLFTVERHKSLNELDNFKGDWLECKPGAVGNFSATAYYFGKMLQEALGVPVGLICSAWGGTRIEPWISENGINNFDWVDLPDKRLKKDFSPQTPTVLFNAMIAPMAGFAIKGGIWYQGESNRNEPKEYEKLMPGLIENWRAEWGIGDFSFFYCQIAPFDYGENEFSSAYLREAQLKASTAISNIGMASLIDVGEKKSIHPANKEAAGERLAYLALSQSYNMTGFEFSGPTLKEMKSDGSTLKLTFDHAQNGLTTFGKKLKNFKVAGKNKRFYSAKAFITRDGITLFSPKVDKPVAVRYAFDDFVVGELYNNEGLPASSFRTDDWEMK